MLVENPSEIGEWLTRGSVWVAISLYVASEIVQAAARRSRSRRIQAGRGLNTVGFVAFAFHVVCAFHFYHDWSHGAAYADTARQTAALTGLNWGGGLYLNYLFLLVWGAEALWQWINPVDFDSRPGWITGSVRGLFLFMIFNGAVVFVAGPARWPGAFLCLLLPACWWWLGKLWLRVSRTKAASSRES